MKVNPNCICGHTIYEPNSDCEHCMLVFEREALLRAGEAMLSKIDYLKNLWGDEEEGGTDG